MEPWISIVITGAAIAGYGLLIPKNASASKTDSSGFQGEAAYDQLLEDLEAENRELIDAVSEFKREQDATVDKLSRRIRDLERQMTEWSDRDRQAASRASAAAPTIASAQEEAAAGLAEAGPVAAPAAANAQGASMERASAKAEEGNGNGERNGNGEEALPSGPVSIRTRYSALLELYERGRSIEQIAKELNMNKGEIQLILQLARREDNPHA
ncbi:hypothetical protein [Cohnella thailandensis]|uniref:Uncharacterized protein n=1 Tax=Cohnella thailandensis TaxID=557557 RepID=A0A841T3T8_9BACL|nr:hypothetical protein [Cohnella thailandensis]MBB6636730.1 hypothetical protein [Cohnella thailandensis]MBP1973394.1 DNA-binding NarL/FixJ family response regulator [Cohnella thailandensis]